MPDDGGVNDALDRPIRRRRFHLSLLIAAAMDEIGKAAHELADADIDAMKIHEPLQKNSASDKAGGQYEPRDRSALLHEIEKHAGFYPLWIERRKLEVSISRCAASAYEARVRIIAIDPSLRSSGFAVMEKNGGKFSTLEYGVVKNPPKLLPSGCLVAIRERIAALIAQHKPECAVFEGVIFVQSHRTAITLGAARGAAVLAAAEQGLPIYEYAPRRVKQSVVGRGGAQKQQVSFMVRLLLGLTETPVPDAADALAVGLTHFQCSESVRQGAVILERI